MKWLDRLRRLFRREQRILKLTTGQVSRYGARDIVLGPITEAQSGTYVGFEVRDDQGRVVMWGDFR